MRKLMGAALGGLLVTCATIPSGFAATSFDGSWRVEVSTASENARCKERTVSLRVTNGEVSYGGFIGVAASGKVDSSGKISAKIAKVRVDGRLIEESGSGVWRTKNCVGTWMARKA